MNNLDEILALVKLPLHAAPRQIPYDGIYIRPNDPLNSLKAKVLCSACPTEAERALVQLIVHAVNLLPGILEVIDSVRRSMLLINNSLIQSGKVDSEEIAAQRIAIEALVRLEKIIRHVSYATNAVDIREERQKILDQPLPPLPNLLDLRTLTEHGGGQTQVARLPLPPATAMGVERGEFCDWIAYNGTPHDYEIRWRFTWDDAIQRRLETEQTLQAEIDRRRFVEEGI